MFVTVVFVSRLCGARSVQCFSVVVEMVVHVFVSSVVTVNVRRRWTSRRRTERTFATRGVQFGVFQVFLCGEWPCVANAERRSRDKALRMVVNVAGGVD